MCVCVRIINLTYTHAHTLFHPYSLDEKRLNASMSSMKRRHSGAHTTSTSAMDINAISVEVDSACSSPGLPRVSMGGREGKGRGRVGRERGKRVGIRT